jgi:hypothetical protein
LGSPRFEAFTIITPTNPSLLQPIQTKYASIELWTDGYQPSLERQRRSRLSPRKNEYRGQRRAEFFEIDEAVWAETRDHANNVKPININASTNQSPLAALWELAWVTATAASLTCARAKRDTACPFFATTRACENSPKRKF